MLKFLPCADVNLFLMTGSLGSSHSSGPELPNARSYPHSLPHPRSTCATLKPRREGTGGCVRVAGRGEGPGSMIYRPLGCWG